MVRVWVRQHLSTTDRTEVALVDNNERVFYYDTGLNRIKSQSGVTWPPDPKYLWIARPER